MVTKNDVFGNSIGTKNILVEISVPHLKNKKKM